MLKISLKLYFLLVFLFANNEGWAEDSQLGVSPVVSNLVAMTPIPTPTAVPMGISTVIPTAIPVAIPNPIPTSVVPMKVSAVSGAVEPSLGATEGVTEWKLEGGFGFKAFFLPSSNYTKNTFSGPALNILGRKQLKSADVHSQNQYYAQGSFDLFSKTETQSGHFLPVLRDAFLESKNSEAATIFKLGYFLSPMLERERSFWQGYRTGIERAGLWERYAYLKTTEVGFEYGSINSDNQWRVGFASADAEKAEPMVQKDMFVLWEVLPQEHASFYGGLSAQKGWYEGLPLKLNNKDRAFIWWGYRNPNGLQLTIEGFAAIDAVDGLKKPVAEGVDFNLKAGQLVRAKGEALLLGRSFEWSGQKFRLDLKIDELDPDTELEFNTVQSNSLAITIPNEVGHFTFSLENMYLQKSHSIGNKQRSTLRFDYLIEI